MVSFRLRFLELNCGLEADGLLAVGVLDVTGDVDLATQERLDQVGDLTNHRLDSVA
jgi:hypothetical protein